MSMKARIERVEEKCHSKHKCMVIAAVWNGTQGPTTEQSDQYKELQRENGQCGRCSGFCVLDWTSNPPRIWQGGGINDLARRQDSTKFVIGKGYVEGTGS